MKRAKRRAGGEVVVGDFRDFDQAMKYFVKHTDGIVREAKRRRWFIPRLTRSARKRRGLALEKRGERFDQTRKTGRGSRPQDKE